MAGICTGQIISITISNTDCKKKLMWSVLCYNNGQDIFKNHHDIVFQFMIALLSAIVFFCLVIYTNSVHLVLWCDYAVSVITCLLHSKELQGLFGEYAPNQKHLGFDWRGQKRG